VNVKYEGFIPFTEVDIAGVEHCIGCSLEKSLKSFYADYNGVKPELNDVLSEREGEICITQFIPVQGVVAELENFEFGRNVLPMAWAEGGNYVVYNVEDGLIYFLDHEVLDVYFLLANGVQEFIDKLVPVKTLVKPENYKVKDVWIDPEFLKRIQSGEFE
jgi:hypothetical protein